MMPLTLEFVRKAEGDYDVACLLRKSRKLNRYDAICFHSQQCVEKYLKARFQQAHIRFAKMHNLVSLIELLRQVEPLWQPMEPQLKTLTDYAVTVRYLGHFADLSAAQDAFVICRRMRSMVRASLGLRVDKR